MRVWLNYALKALRYKKAFDENTLIVVESPFIKPTTPFNISLLEAQKRYEQEPQLYSLFYTQGAFFGHQLDQFLQVHCNKNLDQYLPLILTSDFSQEGGERKDWKKIFGQDLAANIMKMLTNKANIQ